MPRKRKRTMMRRAGLTRYELWDLLWGRDLLKQAYVHDEEARKAAWERNRGSLMTFWLQENPDTKKFDSPGGPGTRPWAWW